MEMRKGRRARTDEGEGRKGQRAGRDKRGMRREEPADGRDQKSGTREVKSEVRSGTQHQDTKNTKGGSWFTDFGVLIAERKTAAVDGKGRGRDERG